MHQLHQLSRGPPRRANLLGAKKSDVIDGFRAHAHADMGDDAAFI
jgi:hypothetical protein